MRSAPISTAPLSWIPWLACLAAANAAAGLLAQDAEQIAFREWFATAPAERGAVPFADRELDRAGAEAMRATSFRGLVEARRAKGDDDLVAAAATPKEATVGELRIGEFTMPYVLLQRGERPARGWPLWICLHGGGGNDAAEGPHAWSVNTGEWNAQKRLYERVYRGEGLWFVPRMADDRKGRWWFEHNQIAFARVIEKAILFRDVDPDRVYLIGISEGGYGAIRFAGNRPDRFAACGGMAAAEPLSTSPPENMRNVAVRIDIGEKDTMFDRIGLARTMGERLAALRVGDPSGFDHVLSVQEGRGHGIDYALTPAWAATKVRNPRPKRVTWTVVPFDGAVDLRHHWLALEERPTRMPSRLAATIEGQRIEISSSMVDGKSGEQPDVDAEAGSYDGTLLVRLDDDLLDLDREIELVVDGEKRPAATARRSVAVLLRTLEERSDPRTAFCAELRIRLGKP